MLPDGKTEADTERDGFLSYAAEWHSFVHGFYAGLRTIRLRAVELPENTDVQKEPAYFKGGFILASLLQIAILVLASYAGVGGSMV